MLAVSQGVKMTQQMPEKLANSPLVETICEIRFEPSTEAAGDLLPGLLFSSLKDNYPEVMPLPMASVPRNIKTKDPDLIYQPSHQLVGGATAVRVGDRSASLTTMEYPGWSRFKEKLELLIQALRTTGLVKQVERFSLKYINIIPASKADKQLSMLNAGIDLPGSKPLERGFRLRIEQDEGKCTTIIQVSPQASAKLSPINKEMSGLLIDVDTIRFDPGNEFLSSPSSLLEEAHSVAKRTFFSLLTKATLEKLQPIE